MRYPIVTPSQRCGGGLPGVKTLFLFPNQTGFPNKYSRFNVYCFRGEPAPLQTPRPPSLCGSDSLEPPGPTQLCPGLLRSLPLAWRRLGTEGPHSGCALWLGLCGPGERLSLQGQSCLFPTAQLDRFPFLVST